MRQFRASRTPVSCPESWDHSNPDMHLWPPHMHASIRCRLLTWSSPCLCMLSSNTATTFLEAISLIESLRPADIFPLFRRPFLQPLSLIARNIHKHPPFRYSTLPRPSTLVYTSSKSQPHSDTVSATIIVLQPETQRIRKSSTNAHKCVSLRRTSRARL